MPQHLAYDQLCIEEFIKTNPNINIWIESNYEYMNEADVVVFDMPLFFHYWGNNTEVTKPANQIWVAWNFGCEAIFPWIKSQNIKSLFDIWMSYHPDSDIILPYYHYSYLEQLKIKHRLNRCKDVCMFISSTINNSHRLEYLKELSYYLKIDSYGKWMNNINIECDEGYKTKLKIISEYKFTIAFENSIVNDYVTEKFYEPLLVGSIPIYMGAPNIDDYSPSSDAFINVNDFFSPKELAQAVKDICNNTNLYQSFFMWKDLEFNSSFIEKVLDQKVHPIEKMIIISQFLLKRNNTH